MPDGDGSRVRGLSASWSYKNARHRIACNHGSDGHACATKLLWTRVQLGVIKSLQRTTLAELVAFAQLPTTTETTEPITHG